MDTIPYENEFGLWVSLEKYKQSQHALWMARTLRAGAEADRYSALSAHSRRDCSNDTIDYFNIKFQKWCWAERKCREKAKEYE